MDLKIIIDKIHSQILSFHEEFQELYPPEMRFRFIQEFIDSEHTDLEKAFFLILHQYAGDHTDYIVVPGEKVLISNIDDYKAPGIEYEIDFALYGGSIDNPVKVAIECDGLR